MLNRIIHWSIQNKLIVAVLTLGIIAWGVFSLSKLPIDAVPDITNNQVQIVTVSPSSGAEDIERFVTFPVEQSMATIPGIEEIRSFSRFGLSVVTIVFNEDTDIYWARQQVLERLSDAKGSIPPGYGDPFLAPLSTGLGEIYQYTLKAKNGYEKKYTPAELRTIQDWVIRRQLLGVKGVADVSGFGGNLKTYEIAIDPFLLRSNGITVTDVFDAIERNNQNTGGAYIERNSMTTYIRTEGLIGNLTDIENIQVKHSDSDMPVFIRDVAKVHYGAAVRYGALTYNTDGEAVGGIVLMLKGANSSEVIGLVKDKMAQIESNLPEGVELNVYLDRTNLVNRAISTVTKNLIEGALIVIFVLVLLLGNLRAGLIVASVIPLAMLIAISLMNVFGVSGNLMSLGALDFGLIVDGAVIIVESTLHLLHRRGDIVLTKDDMDQQVYESASKFSKSAVFGQIIILVVYLPILALVGIEGKMFKPMAQTVIFAILGALVLSLTYVPMISSMFLSKKINTKVTISDKMVNAIRSKYTPVLKALLRRQKMVLSVIGILFVLSIFAFKQLGAEFIPSLDEGDFAVETRLMTGTSLTKTIEATGKASKILLNNFPEVKSVVGKIGTAEIPTDPMPMEACDLMIILKDKDEWTSAHTKEELANKMQAKLEESLPNVSFGFLQPIQMRFNELMTGAKQDVVVKIYGEEFDKLATYSKQIGSIASKIKGVQDVYVEEMSGLPQMIVEYDREALARYDVSLDEVNRVVNLGFAGQASGFVFEGEKRFELVVKLKPEFRDNITDLSQLFVSNANGKEIPISELAHISIKNGPNQIQRDDAKRRILVGFNVRGRDVESIVQELEKEMKKSVKFETGYFPKIGGTFENLIHARDRLMIAVPVSLLLIFFLLYLTFQSLKQAALIFSAIPLASIGGIYALYFRDMPFSISAGVGFIALFGVAVLNGIVLIAEFNTLRKSGLPLMMVVIRGTGSRLRPVLLTAAVASLGFLPMALSHGSGAEVQKPLATVVIGGLISATLLTLFILPILYLIFEKPMKRKKRNSASLMILLLIGSGHLFGQTTMNYQQAYERMLTQNGQITAARLEQEKQIVLGRSMAEMPKTTLNGMVGQYNSYYNKDNNISINQSIPFPTVFQDEKKLGLEKGKLSQLEADVLVKDLTQKLAMSFDHYAYLKAQIQYLQSLDSSLLILEEKSKIRLELQDISRLDFALVQTKRMRIANDISLLNSELIGEKRKIAALIKMDDRSLEIAVSTYEMQTRNVSNIDPMAHPYVQWYQQNETTVLQEKKVNLSRQLPEFNVGYFNQTLVGVQNVNGVDTKFTQANRFQGYMVGANVPIFWGGYKNRNEASAIALQQNSLQLDQAKQAMQLEYTQLMDRLNLISANIDKLGGQLTNELRFLSEDAKAKFEVGEISFIEFLQIQQQRSELELSYLQLINQYNQTSIQLNWYR
ncbi:MAG: CusA/CzcA family heavy metal efflux RND transporter [Flavobacteriales bacterium]